MTAVDLASYVEILSLGYLVEPGWVRKLKDTCQILLLFPCVRVS
jgi:hypothetical protein